ncbi:pentapeptide repeat-containing protein [Nocardia sp. NPDC051463]|uniref:pentapeptide repeat-containing protein n=1 Tax=Nocardia sp. NPDC051463 TaxID=3154845 RepID=UPI00342B1109
MPTAGNIAYRAQFRIRSAIIVRAITDYLRPDAEYSWSTSDFDFRSARLEDVDFDRAAFCNLPRFDNATFTGNARFVETTFTDRASFAEATFTGNAVFGRATFTGNARFVETTFTDRASFAEATFTGNAVFGRPRSPATPISAGHVRRRCLVGKHPSATGIHDHATLVPRPDSFCRIEP